MSDPAVDALSELQWIPGRAYPSPAHLVEVPGATFGTPYKATSWGLQPMFFGAYEVPQFTYASNQNMPVNKAQQSNLGNLHGAAPTQGIYTGIPSGCNGGMGGNPYS